MITFEFATAHRIIFGAGKLSEVGTLAASFGSCALVVTGNTPLRVTPLLDLLDEYKVRSTTFQVDGEPTIESVQQGVALARDADAQLVIGIGGGSVLDSAKAIAALTTNPGEPMDYLEVIGKGQKLTQTPLPVIAIPTTAGTGSEVTSNAVLASKEHRVKVSLRSPMMLPRVALVDPTLTYSVPRLVTAYTGMDALTQNLEPFVTHLSTPMTDALCRDGLQRAGKALVRAYEGDHAARDDMALVSLLGGIVLANAKLGAVHGFAGVIGGMFDAPHGAICARLLPYVTETNIHALRSRELGNPALAKYDEAARFLTSHSGAVADDLIPWLHRLLKIFEIPNLATYGITQADFADIVEKSANASSMKGNPIKLTSDELTEILAKAL